MARSLSSDEVDSIQLISSSDDKTSEHLVATCDIKDSKKMSRRYFSLLSKSLHRPRVYLRELRSDAVSGDHWTRSVGWALSTFEACRMAHMKALVSMQGMSIVEHGWIKSQLKTFLQRRQNKCLEDPEAGLIADGSSVLGLRLNDGIHTGYALITENPPEQRPYKGFHFLGQCRARVGMLPKGLGDLVIVDPPEELKYPILLRVSRSLDNPKISIQTRVNIEPGLNSNTEIISWASGMISKKLSRVMPYLSPTLQSLEVVNPLSNDTIRPWFGFSDEIRSPSLFGWKCYITPHERLFASDRDKYACLGSDGDFFWGICIANAVLKKFGRSDLISL